MLWTFFQRIDVGMHTGSNSLDELVVYVGLFDLPFTVHEPPELITRIRALATRLNDAVPGRGSR